MEGASSGIPSASHADAEACFSLESAYPNASPRYLVLPHPISQTEGLTGLMASGNGTQPENGYFEQQRALLINDVAVVR